MEEIVKKRVVAVVAVIVLLVGASVASIIYMKSGKNDGSKTAYIYRDNELSLGRSKRRGVCTLECKGQQMGGSLESL